MIRFLRAVTRARADGEHARIRQVEELTAGGQVIEERTEETFNEKTGVRSVVTVKRLAPGDWRGHFALLDRMDKLAVAAVPVLVLWLVSSNPGPQPRQTPETADVSGVSCFSRHRRLTPACAWVAPAGCPRRNPLTNPLPGLYLRGGKRRPSTLMEDGSCASRCNG